MSLHIFIYCGADRTASKRLVDVDTPELFAVAAKSDSIIAHKNLSNPTVQTTLGNFQIPKYTIATEYELGGPISSRT